MRPRSLARAVPSLLAAAALAALVVAAFAPGLSAEFLDFDDDQLLTLNRAWRGLGADRIAWMFRTNMMGHFQPLTWLSFAIDHRLHGLSAPAYHATSIGVHALAAVALLLLTRTLLRLALPDVGEPRRTAAAALGTALWALHPLRVESVVWLTERRDVLSGLFLVIALRSWLAWVPGARRRPAALDAAIAGSAAVAAGAALAALDLSDRTQLHVRSAAALGLAVAAWVLSGVLLARAPGRGGPLALALGSLLLSLLAKAWGMVLPAVLVVLDVWPLRRWRDDDARSLLVEKLPMAAPAVVFAVLAHWAQASAVGVMKTWSEHPLAARVAQAIYGLAYYPRRTLAPVGLLPIYELPRTIDPSEPRWLVSGAVVLAAGATLIALRRRLPGTVAAFAVYAIVVAPVLGLVQSGPQLVADRYGYVACMPFAVLLAGAAAVAAGRRPRLVATLGLAALAASAVATAREAAVWRTSTSLWEHAAALAPDSPMILNSLGTLRSAAAEHERDPQRAFALLTEAFDLHRRAFDRAGDPIYLRNLAQVETSMSAVDRAHAADHQSDALALSRRALALARERDLLTPEYDLSYGTALVNAGRVDEGIARLRAYVRDRPDRLRGLVNLGGALTIAGRPDEALGYLDRACALEPDDPRAWTGRAHALEAAGRRADALAAWRRVLVLSPGDPVASARVAALDAGDGVSPTSP